MNKKVDAPRQSSKKTQFKLHKRSHYKGTVLMLVIFVVMTGLVYKAMPAELPMFVQKLVGLAHACVAAVLAMTVIKETMPKSAQPDGEHHHGESDHKHDQAHKHADTKTAGAMYPPKAVTASTSHAQEFSHLHHMHLAVQRRRKTATIVAGVIFVLVFGLWFTPAAPIKVQHIDVDLASQLNDAATQTFLIVTDPSIPAPLRPTIYKASIESAKKMYSGGSSYRQGMIALAKEDFEQARTLLRIAKEETPNDADKIDLALGQVDLFSGDMQAAVKQFEGMCQKNKGGSLATAHLIVAHLHGGNYQKALPIAQKLCDQNKSATAGERSRNVNLLLAARTILWNRSELTKLQSEAVKISAENPDVHFAALKNNLAVLEILATPPNYGAAQIYLNKALELAEQAKQQWGSEAHVEPCDFAVNQNQNAIQCQISNPDDALVKIIQSFNRLKEYDELTPEWIASKLSMAFGESLSGNYSSANDLLTASSKLLEKWPKNNLFVLSQILLGARNDESLGRWTSAVNKDDLVIKRFSDFSRIHPAVAKARLQKLLVTIEMPAKNSEEGLKEIEKMIAEVNEAFQNASFENDLDLASIHRCEAYVSWQQKDFPKAYAQIQSALDALSGRIGRNDSTGKFPLRSEAAELLALKARVQMDDKKGEDALKTMADAERVMRESFGGETGNSHPLTGEMILKDAKLLFQMNRNGDCEKKLNDWEQNIAGEMPHDHPWLLEAMELHSAVLQRLKKNKDAKGYDDRIKDFRAKMKSSGN